jgi:lipoprotein NlpI
MIRFVCALALSLAISLSAQADVVDLLKAGLAARSRGDFDGAIYYYTQAIASGELAKPYLATVLNGRGVAYDVKGEVEKAIGDFDAAIRLKPDYGEAYINRGLAWVQKRDYDRAIADFTEAAALDRRFAHLAFSNRGIAYGEKRDYQRGIQDFDEAIRLRPDYAPAYYGRGNIYNAIGDTDKAIADFGAAIRIQPDFQAAYTNRGALHISNGDTDKAIADFDAAIRLNPSDVLALGNRAFAFGSKREYGRAVADLNEAIRLDPFNASIYFKRGLIRLYSGDADAAAQDFATSVRLRPSDGYGVIWLHLARVRAHLDDRRELAQNATNIDGAKWPGPLVDLLLGSLSRDAVSTSAFSGSNGTAGRKRACDIEFYLATFDLEQGEQNEAQRHLRTAADICSPDGIERVAARAELDGIAAKR